ncbi:DWNN domain-domain-containing protein [Absidia repens]|uniref:DWNN domain-domain-containing protein n=1 Tax=Absidia repens TaxID=90262 RepID=A0A1X2IAM4_9FUNG|nr:DWNN domain-domain-containing protein [Absidia repens]
MSVIYYKFKAAKHSDYDVFTFDGSGATVFDVKKEIIRAKRLGKGTDFDLAIYNAQTDEEYNDDMFMVPRNTSVIVRRLPPSRPGKGTAQRYVQGAGPMDGKGMGASGIGIMKGTTQPSSAVHATGRRNMVLNALPQQQQQQHQQALDNTHATGGGVNPFQQSSQGQDSSGDSQLPQQQQQQQTEALQGDTEDSEEARIQAMFQQTTDQWGAMQERLAEQQYIPFNARGGDARRGRGGYQHNGTPRTPDQNSGSSSSAPAGLDSKDLHQGPQKVPPATYVCYRCGQKGHYINQCPTNGDKDYDKHPRIKRTTGIPRSFLKVIEAPKDAVKSGTGGLMVTPKGDIVVAQADSSTWDQHMAKAATALGAGGDLLDWYDSIPSPDYVQCPLCQGLMREATITPCCGASFCDECIRGHLLENDFCCFDCHQHIRHGLDGLIPNTEVRLWIDQYVRRFATSGGGLRQQQQQQQQQHGEDEDDSMDVKNADGGQAQNEDGQQMHLQQQQ